MDEAERLRKQAQDAIARGADPAKVNARLAEMLSQLQSGSQTTPVDTPESHEGAGSKLGAFGRSFLATAANAAQGIPGMEAVQAGARSLVRGQSYRDALGDIRGETERIPTPLRIAGQLPGVVASSGVAPGASAVKVGGAYGAASQALNADPDLPLGERAARTVGGGVAGAVIPAAMKGLATTGRIANTGVRALATKTTPAMLLQQQEAALQAKTGPMYARALKEGQGAVVPPQVRAALDRPQVKEISQRLQGMDDYAGMSDDSPEMIQAIKQALNEQSIALKKPQQLANTGKGAAFSGRAERRQVERLSRDLTDAVATPGQLMGPNQGRPVITAPMMPSQRAADQAHAQGKALQTATEHGVNAVAAANRGTTVGSGLRQRSPEAFERWVQTKASPDEVDAFIKSVMSETGAKMRQGLTPRSLQDFAILPLLAKATRTANAGDRMLMAARKQSPMRVHSAITPSLIDILMESGRER